MSDIYASSTSSTSTFSPPKTIGGIRRQVAEDVALRLFLKSETVDAVKIGVTFTYDQSDDEAYLRLIADAIANMAVLKDYLFALVSSKQALNSPANPLIICGSQDDYVQRAVLLTSSKFLGRIDSVSNEDRLWLARMRGLGQHSGYDHEALWDVVRKAVIAPIDPLLPPPGSRGIDQVLSDARAKLQRVTPIQAYEELRETAVGAPTFLVDIRPAAQRETYGGIQGSLIIERNVLEWRFDPRSESRLPIVDRYDLRVIIFCQEGYTSSLAAYSLQEMGLLNATDIIGGYDAWQKAGLPVDGIAASPTAIQISNALQMV